MKRAFAIICAIAVVLSLSVTAFADGASRNQSFGSSQQMPGKFQQGRGPSMGDQAPTMGGQAPDMNGRPRMTGGQGLFGKHAFVDFDTMVEDGVISQDTCDKIKSYMEENKPNDLPEMNGEAPEMGNQPPMMNGQSPMMNGQVPDDEAPADLPELPESDSEAADLPEPPAMNGEAPVFDGEDPMISGLLTDLLEDGVITQSEYNALVAAITD